MNLDFTGPPHLLLFEIFYNKISNKSLLRLFGGVQNFRIQTFDLYCKILTVGPQGAPLKVKISRKAVKIKPKTFGFYIYNEAILLHSSI